MPSLDVPALLHATADSQQSDLRDDSQVVNAEAKLDQFDRLFSDAPDPDDERAFQCGDLAARIRSLRIALAPHTKLPLELWAEIFLFCSTAPVSLPPSPDHPLLAVTQVSRRWRELALQVSELWGSISLSFTREDTDVQRIMGIAEQWISRTGPFYPLSITAGCTDPYATIACENPELVSAFVPLVIAHAHHIQRMDLTFPSKTFLPLFGLPAGAFPCLETLALRPLLALDDMAPPETGHAGWHWPSASITFESAPLIHQVTYNPVFLFQLEGLEALAEGFLELADWDGIPALFAPTMPLPWSQLSVISFPYTALTVDSWRSILIQCLKVTRLEVAIKPFPTSNGNPIRLQYLTFLSISAYSGGGNHLIDALVAPELTVLILFGIYITSSLISFRLRSDFSLQVFTPITPISIEDIEPLFEALPDLKALVLILISTEHFPASFWERVGRFELLPHLGMLRIRPTATQAPALVDMIVARWEARLSSSFAASFYDVNPAHLEAINDEIRRLEQCTEGGRTVEIQTTATLLAGV
ncbi:hypothetical protein C8R43DRAFT_977156 [Mycena crocata]|nr:hypothetical protein C8R43DRAFT_977156 [Mycena crocata]